MKTVRNCLSLLALIVALGANVVYAQEENKANADDLLGNAQQSVAVVVAAAKKDPALNADEAKAKPFWNGIQDLNSNLDKARSSLSARNDDFFAALASARSGFVQAEIAVIMNGSKDANLSKGMNFLGGILDTLNQNFSKEAARMRDDRPLTEQEKQQLDRLIAQQDELLKKLEEVEKNVAKNDANMKEGIEKIREESKKIRRARRTGSGFAAGFFAGSIMYDWLWGWHWWWGPWGGWCPGYIDIGIVIWDDWGTLYDYDWDVMDTYVDVDGLGLDEFDLDDASLAGEMDYLESGDFGLEEGDLDAMTSDLDYGWDDVSSNTGAEIAESYESNFDNSGYYDRAEPVETFNDYGMDDFGGGFDSGGFDFDW